MNLPSDESSSQSIAESLPDFQPSQPLYQAIIQLVTNEVSAPELLPYNEIFDQLIVFTQNLQATSLEQFRAQRIFQLLSIYFNSRLRKIENVAQLDNSNMSEAEKEFAQQVGRAQMQIQKQVLSNLSERIGKDYQSLIVEDKKQFIQQYQKDVEQQRVFAVFNEDCRIGDIIFKQGDCQLLHYGIVKSEMLEGKIGIYGFCD